VVQQHGPDKYTLIA